MPVCKKCDTRFPNRIKVDGKIKNVQRRKYCLDCSPWGLHNTRKIHLIGDPTVCRKCPRCKEKKLVKDFYQRRGVEGSSTYCKVCTNLQTIERQQKFKIKCVEYMGGSCKFCNYKKYVGSLEFHHLDHSKKDFTISQVKLLSFSQSITDELDKCIMLCSNCHKEEHARLKGLIE